MDFDFEFVLEGFALGLDGIVLGFLFKSYESCSAYIEALKEAEQVDIADLGQFSAPKSRNRSWFQFWKSNPTPSKDTSDSHRYVCVRGRVEPVDNSKLLQSNDKLSTGVIHRVVTKEIATVRNGSRFWVEEERVVKNVQHEVPWRLRPEETRSKQSVQISDGLSADHLDMTVVRDEFTPAPLSFSAWLGGWVAGQQLKGTQEVEEIIMEGSLVTAVGELVVNSDGTMYIRSPSSCNQRFPFFLSNMPFNDLLSTYENLVSVCKWSILLFGGVGAVICYLMIRNRLRQRYNRRRTTSEDDILRQLQQSRLPPDENPQGDWQRCVVCLTNNREVIVLPCGHVCLCADCMILINQQEQRNCPVCRQQIVNIARAFVS